MCVPPRTCILSAWHNEHETTERLAVRGFEFRRYARMYHIEVARDEDMLL
jgi:hypothetical protein